MAFTRKHYVHTKRRSDLWVAHRTDRDRTTERIEFGDRVWDAMRRENKETSVAQR